mgnify:CR=1 FL=1
MAAISGLIRVMEKAARKAGQRLRRDFGEVEHLQVSRKGPADFVSKADMRSERTLYDELLAARPGWGFVMEEAGVIQGYTVRINPQSLDLADTVLVQVTLDSHSDNTLEKFGETLASIPEVIEAHLVSGDYDYLLRIVVKDTRDYERLLREKRFKFKGIRHSRSSFVLRTLKKADLPLFVG